jgi:hypothetical protein
VTHPTRKLGRRPPDWSKPRALATFAPELPGPSVGAADWLARIDEWRMLLNDQLGDCVPAAMLHARQSLTTYGQGTEFEPTDAQALALYEAIGGYRPGDPGSDQGCVMQDAYDYWRRTGIDGHRLVAFAMVDHTNWVQVRAALYWFGAVGVGVNFPASAMTQTDKGQRWDVVPDDGGILGGHAVLLGADPDTGDPQVITWGKRQNLTRAWWDRYVEEAWVVVSPEWMSAAGLNPEGADWAALADAFHATTGGTFTPPVIVTPPPGPPVPPADPDLAAWWAVVRHWAGQHHVGDNHRAAAACNRLAKAKGL